MKVIAGFGKTTELLQEAARTGWPLITWRKDGAKILRQVAVDQGLDVTVLEASEVRSYYQGRAKPSNMLVDDTEWVLFALTGIPVATMAVGAGEVQVTTRTKSGSHVEINRYDIPDFGVTKEN